MAMLPFCGYNMADYFRHWLKVGSGLTHPPKMFFVNWFKKDADGKFVWPGFRDNSRVIKWMVDRIKGKVHARETPVGLMPHLRDLDMEGLSLRRQLDKLFEVDKDEWRKEVEETRVFYSQFGDRLPAVLARELSELKEKIENS